ncbi:MAG TPA: rhodanese-like domain-containing protein [Verrucomicrobiae bacterium]|nr:rhodanese-like domain-containing protein [Verrucomicrobiae bacterium]
MKSITASELAGLLKLVDAPKLLDVREPEEFEIASLPGARLVPLGQIPASLEQIADWKNEAIVVYCHHGIRSMHAITFLEHAGFKNLANLSGGIDAWSREVDPKTPRY